VFILYQSLERVIGSEPMYFRRCNNARLGSQLRISTQSTVKQIVDIPDKESIFSLFHLKFFGM
jgi:hypothetical protein